jgi:hypothetical protein
MSHATRALLHMFNLGSCSTAVLCTASLGAAVTCRYQVTSAHPYTARVEICTALVFGNQITLVKAHFLLISRAHGVHLGLLHVSLQLMLFNNRYVGRDLSGMPTAISSMH